MSYSYKKLKKQISFSTAYKLVVLLLNYLLISLLVDYLGNKNFGIYIALTSLFNWMFLFDLGIAKGMRNFITIAILNNNMKEAKEYISTTYISVFFLTVISCLLIIFYLSFLNIQAFFNVELENSYLNNIIIVLIIGFFLKFYFSTVDQLNFATHKSHNVLLNDSLVAVINFIGIIILFKIDHSSSILWAIYVFSISIILPYFFSTLYFFYNHKELIPSIYSYSKKKLARIFNQGSKILLIQIGFLLFIGLDRLIILKYGSAIEVSKYEIIYKVMSILTLPVSVLMAPLWSAYTAAYEINDIVWIKSIFKKFYIAMIGLFISMLILAFLFNSITSIWLNNFPYINVLVTLAMGILILELIWSTFHTEFLLGIKRLKYIVYMLSFGLLLKYSFLYFFISLEGEINIIVVIISSTLAYLIYNLSAPFYISKLLHRRKLNG